MSLNDKINRLLLEFPNELDWEEKYKRIINKGKQLAEMPTDLKIESHLIKGCQSQVWLAARLDENTRKMILQGDSDALIVKGLVAILIELFSEEAPGEVLNTPLNFFDKMGLKSHLSPSRANGFFAMLKQILNYAIAFDYLLKAKD